MISKEDFKKEEFYWLMSKTNKFFLGKEIFIIIETKSDFEEPLPDIYYDQIKVLNLVLPNWEVLETQIENEILNYELIPREEFIKVFHKPHIRMYMDMENEKPLGNNKWSFNVGVNVNEDFGWYCDFEGLDCIETGAGD